MEPPRRPENHCFKSVSQSVGHAALLLCAALRSYAGKGFHVVSLKKATLEAVVATTNSGVTQTWAQIQAVLAE